MNGIVENLIAAGVLAGGQRLVDLLTGGRESSGRRVEWH
jgi:hypothetical protein